MPRRREPRRQCQGERRQSSPEAECKTASRRRRRRRPALLRPHEPCRAALVAAPSGRDGGGVAVPPMPAVPLYVERERGRPLAGRA